MVVYHLNTGEIYHRDPKPDNFLIKTGQNGRIYLYLTDFRFAKTASSEDNYSRRSSYFGVKGTLEYLAPETLNQN